MNRKTKVRKSYNLLLQLAILVLTYGFIYDQVFYQRDLPTIVALFLKDFSGIRFLLLMILVLVLMFLNWGIESEKWRYLMRSIERIPFWKAYQAVLTGITISSFTPNRVGEYFGRVFMLRNGSRIEGILITILGSMSQLMVTILTGSVALLAFIPLFLDHYHQYNGYLYILIMAVVIALNVLLVTLFLNVGFINIWKDWVFKKRFKRFRKFFRIFGFFSQKELIWVLFLSLVRYLVFSTQFFLLLRMFSVPVAYFPALMLISLIYFVMTVIPTIALTEMGVRGSVAIYFFTIYFGGDLMTGDGIGLGVLAATTVLWAINLGLPAIVGSIFVFRLRFFRKTSKNGQS